MSVYIYLLMYILVYFALCLVGYRPPHAFAIFFGVFFVIKYAAAKSICHSRSTSPDLAVTRPIFGKYTLAIASTSLYTQRWVTSVTPHSPYTLQGVNLGYMQSKTECFWCLPYIGTNLNPEVTLWLTCPSSLYTPF